MLFIISCCLLHNVTLCHLYSVYAAILKICFKQCSHVLLSLMWSLLLLYLRVCREHVGWRSFVDDLGFLAGAPQPASSSLRYESETLCAMISLSGPPYRFIAWPLQQPNSIQLCRVRGLEAVGTIFWSLWYDSAEIWTRYQVMFYHDFGFARIRTHDLPHERRALYQWASQLVAAPIIRSNSFHELMFFITFE